jgi:hypothetical protein
MVILLVEDSLRIRVKVSPPKNGDLPVVDIPQQRLCLEEITVKIGVRERDTIGNYQ